MAYYMNHNKQRLSFSRVKFRAVI